MLGKHISTIRRGTNTKTSTSIPQRLITEMNEEVELIHMIRCTSPTVCLNIQNDGGGLYQSQMAYTTYITYKFKKLVAYALVLCSYIRVYFT